MVHCRSLFEVSLLYTKQFGLTLANPLPFHNAEHTYSNYKRGGFSAGVAYIVALDFSNLLKSIGNNMNFSQPQLLFFA